MTFNELVKLDNKKSKKDVQTSPLPRSDPKKSTPVKSKKRVKKGSRGQRTNDKTNERTKVRHTFDIYKDQIFSLEEIKLQRKKADNPKWRMGDMAQEAIDRFVTKELRN